VHACCKQIKPFIATIFPRTRAVLSRGPKYFYKHIASPETARDRKMQLPWKHDADTRTRMENIIDTGYLIAVRKCRMRERFCALCEESFPIVSDNESGFVGFRDSLSRIIHLIDLS